MTAVFIVTLLSTFTVPQSGLALAAVQTGSDSSGSGDSGDDDRECSAPLVMRTDNSGSGSDGNEIEGRRLFVRENCYSCHGGFAGGLMCPNLRDDKPNESDVRNVVENGTENGMPPYPHLTEQDIENLCAYFQSLRTRCEPTFFNWWEPVPTQ